MEFSILSSPRRGARACHEGLVMAIFVLRTNIGEEYLELPSLSNPLWSIRPNFGDFRQDSGFLCSPESGPVGLVGAEARRVNCPGVRLHLAAMPSSYRPEPGRTAGRTVYDTRGRAQKCPDLPVNVCPAFL